MQVRQARGAEDRGDLPEMQGGRAGAPRRPDREAGRRRGVGGTGSVVGPLLGAAALLFAEDALSAVTQHWQVVLGPLLVLIVLFARQGIAGALGIRSR